MTRQTLVAAWAAWDARPGDDYTAAAMEAQCQDAAKQLGVTGTNLREVLMEFRREGLNYLEAVDATVKKLREYS